MTKKQMLFTLFLFGSSVSASAMDDNHLNSSISRLQVDKIGLQQLKAMGIVVWNADQKTWELDLAMLQSALGEGDNSATPFDEHAVYSDKKSGPLANGNW